ncbi:CaiB/BaiF CoA transferase family protein [Brevibacterium sp. CFH 10365]|uniref:CaiB/BaiF CoA transferase family protein n=1 Tax=Brevibacterium sp. CFH 10365 TaxID=2585207 RepID=UPI0012667B11|nr:CoA transferase [Brevibacterium sp. CFH 10365]
MPNHGPLTGIRVLDMTNVLAGPFAAYQLSLSGADVIKVEVPGGGDLARSLGADPELNSAKLGASFIAQNSGKRSIAINLKTESGRAAFSALLRESDVLLENFRPGVLARLGFGEEELHALNPGLVYCAISGFGQSGPLRDRPAYDQIIQGLSGMMSSSGTADTGPLRAGYPVADTLGGMAASFAISAALLDRERTGSGSVIDVSMLETAITAMGWVVSNYLVAGREPVPMGNENFTAAPSGMFMTGDGRINISANKQEQFEDLARYIGREDLIGDPRFAEREARKTNRHELRGEIEQALAHRSAAEWEEGLADIGVPAGRVLDIGDVLTLPQVRERALVHEVANPSDENAALSVLGNGIRINGAPSSPQAGPPLLGEHTDAILLEAGLDQKTINELRAAGGIS